MDCAISFCIITNGCRLRKLNNLLDSIEMLQIPRCEVIISGSLNSIPDKSSLNIVYCKNEFSAKHGFLGKMRNDAVKSARYDLLVIVDDDVTFENDFYTELMQFLENNSFDVLCTRFLNPDRSRYWDWAIENDKEQKLIKYQQNHPDVYVTGGRCIIKRDIALKVPWNESLGFYEKEDVDFSKRVKHAGYSITINPRLTIIHNDWRYTQRKDMVRRYGVLKVLFRNVYRLLGLVNEEF